MRSEDGVMWIVINAFSSKEIEEKWPIFRDEPHHVKISLVVDDVNLFV